MGELLDYRPMKSNWLTYHRGQKNFIELQPNLEIGGFLILDQCCSLHETVKINGESLKKSWNKNFEYYEKTLSAKNWIANKYDIEAPQSCYPIYFFSVGEGEKEKVVYIGKTASEHGRFTNGHKACSLLHHPKYDNLPKRLYQCSIQFLNTKSGIVPIEWVQPLEYALDLLSKIEAMLIYEFQPELNTHYKSNIKQFDMGVIHIQNISSNSSFLWDYFVYGR